MVAWTLYGKSNKMTVDREAFVVYVFLPFSAFFACKKTVEHCRAPVFNPRDEADDK